MDLTLRRSRNASHVGCLSPNPTPKDGRWSQNNFDCGVALRSFGSNASKGRVRRAPPPGWQLPRHGEPARCQAYLSVPFFSSPASLASFKVEQRHPVLGLVHGQQVSALSVRSTVLLFLVEATVRSTGPLSLQKLLPEYAWA